MRACGTGAGRLSPHSPLQKPPVEWPGGLHQHSKALLSVPHLFSLRTLLVLCLSLHFQHTPTSQDRLQGHGILSLSPHGLHVLPPPPLNMSLGPVLPGGVCSRLMPGPAEHLEESQLEAVTCQHLLGAHLALLPREIPASLYPVFLSFWLNFCCFPHAVPSCSPAAAQGGSWSPLCTFQHCLPCLLAACP